MQNFEHYIGVSKYCCKIIKLKYIDEIQISFNSASESNKYFIDSKVILNCV